ncbi:MAG TPA: hypothetical protein VK421_20640 [Pyrinomonadaceae bacterium]|nr:hypothetical protein [Pyrinomonadaceae bacterium]
MKRLSLCLLLLLSCVCSAALAQTPTAAASADAAQSLPGVELIKHSWSKDRIGWESDPFAPTVENMNDVRRRIGDQRRAERARSIGNTAEAAKVEQEMRSEQVIRARPPKPPRYAFTYKLSVRNTGQKPIKEIDWDYVFFDAATGEELGRREFTGVEKIAPGKGKELVFLVGTPPTSRISAHSLGKNERTGLREEVVIVRVLYEDGTVWQRQ